MIAHQAVGMKDDSKPETEPCSNVMNFQLHNNSSP